MNLIPEELRAQLLANGRLSIQNENFDPTPVVKLFTPDAGATWLLTEIDPKLINNERNVLFRCVLCSRAFHLEHLPPRTNEDDMDGGGESVAEQRFREGVHLARRIGIERLGRLVGRRTASQESARKQAAKAEVRPCTCTGSARDRLEYHAPSPRFSFARF